MLGETLLLVVIVLIGLGYWVLWRYRNRRLLQLSALIPGPKPWPIVGNAWDFIMTPSDTLKLIGGYLTTHGQYAKFWLGPDLNICISNPTDVRLLLTSNKVNQKGPFYNFMKRLIGPGILSGGSTWKSHRKIANSSYNKTAMQSFLHVFNKDGEQLAQALSCKNPNENINVYYDVVRATTNTVCQTVMGLSEAESKNVKRLEEVMLQTHQLYNFLFNNMTQWWYHIPPVYWMFRGREERRITKMIDELSACIMKMRRKALEKGLKPVDETLSVVDRFILSEQLTDQEIKWETFTLFTASQEATAKIASTTLLVLAHHPEWQEKVYNEIVEVLGIKDDFVTDEQVKQLKYLDVVYKEAVRYMPIGAFIQRTIEEEVAINNGKLVLPAGAALIIPIHLMHRDPLYWDEPDKIKPERFLPENLKSRDPNAYVPFSLGAMDCIGRVFATTLIKIFIVRVLRSVRLEADGKMEDLELEVAISAKFVKGYQLRARPRLKQ